VIIELILGFKVINSIFICNCFARITLSRSRDQGVWIKEDGSRSRDQGAIRR